jgi:hypothetical protein
MLEQILAGLSLGNPLALLINLIVSTLVGGAVFLLVVLVFSKAFSEEARIGRAFLVVLVINIINLFGIMALVTPYIMGIPFVGYIMLVLPLLIWIGLVKAFFRDMEASHIIVIGVAGYALSVLVFPWVTGLVAGYIPAV